MAPACTICTHPQRSLIEADLLARVPRDEVLRKYQVSNGAIARHRSGHMGAVTAAVSAQIQRTEVQRVEGVVGLLGAAHERARALEDQALRLSSEAADQNKLTPAIMALGEARQSIGEQRQILTVMGKANGEIPSGGVNVNVLVNAQGEPRPELAALLDVVADALEPFPDAARAVGKALREWRDGLRQGPRLEE
jgi:hypothetical protein